MDTNLDTPNNILSLVGNWSSIVGLLLTIVLGIFGYFINSKIKEIQRNIKFGFRIKKLIYQLDKSKSKYPKLLEDYVNSIKDIRYEVLQTEVILKDIKSKVTGQEINKINTLLDQIWIMKIGNFINEKDRKKGGISSIRSLFLKRSETSEDNVWDFYTELSAFQTQLENLIEDKKTKQYE